MTGAPGGCNRRLGALSGADLLSTDAPRIIMCDQVAWLNQGRLAAVGDAKSVIAAYKDDIATQGDKR